MRDLLRHPRAAAAAIAAVLAACAVLALERGPDWTPAPLVEVVSWLFGYPPPLAARMVIAAELALAAAVLVAGTRAWNLFASVSLAFFALACASRGFNDGIAAMVPSILALAAGAVLIAHARWARPEHSSAARRGLSPGWSLLAGLFAATATSNLTAGVEFRAVREARAAASASAKKPDRPVSIDLDLSGAIGKRLSDTAIASYLRDVVDEIGDGDAFIVFYNPDCETCHTVFREHFLAPRPELVFAVEIPLADGAVSAARGEREPIECLGCQMRSLPQGPLWMIAPPMTVKVTGGVVTCVADRFGGDCFTAAQP
ncbi:MAG: hypothetical protein ACKOYN_12045 [Planctomycetota bacterium]